MIEDDELLKVSNDLRAPAVTLEGRSGNLVAFMPCRCLSMKPFHETSDFLMPFYDERLLA